MKKENNKKIIPLLMWGALSLSSYLMIFLFQNEVLFYATRGGLFSVVPILFAFYFSFVHGAFASYLLPFIGVEAIIKKEAH
ncbi:hypothetical protein [Thermodesulfobium sp.]|jgi:hypothetical protein|uniref:CPBP family intramembrane metalloprotease n=1 Tax=Thermodesulfobium narugense TaxID=184064 RepID=A0A7C5KAP3_9BACT